MLSGCPVLAVLCASGEGQMAGSGRRVPVPVFLYFRGSGSQVCDPVFPGQCDCLLPDDPELPAVLAKGDPPEAEV